MITFRKRLFPSACPTNGIVSLRIPSMFFLTRPASMSSATDGLRQRWNWLGRLPNYEEKLNYQIFQQESWKIFLKPPSIWHKNL
jgi:hypothetical protein